MINPTKSSQITAQQRQEAVDLCLSEGLSCTAVAQRLGIPISSLAKWVRQARIDRGDFGPPEQVAPKTTLPATATAAAPPATKPCLVSPGGFMCM